MQVVIEKKDFGRMVDALAGDRTLIAPIELENGDLLYSHVQQGMKVCLETDRVPLMSAKEFFFESEEPLFYFEKEGTRDWRLTLPPEAEERVFLGIRSCDLKGVRYIQQFFQEPLKDETVIQRIEKTLFISLGCPKPAPTCFCVCCDGGPFLNDGFDIQLVDLEDRFLCDVLTAGGEDLVSEHSDLVRPATEEDREAKTSLLERVDRAFTRRSYMAAGVKAMSLDSVPEKVWSALENRCIGCGGCAFVCPTCTCFNVVDRFDGPGGVRVRTWDSCSYSGFTREASGHNPRAKKAERLKRRFYHKLSYQSLVSTGRLGCVGCGRCVLACPALVDMSTFVTTLRDYEAHRSHG